MNQQGYGQPQTYGPGSYPPQQGGYQQGGYQQGGHQAPPQQGYPQHQGYGQGGYQQPPRGQGQGQRQQSSPPVRIKGVPRDQRPGRIADDVRERYREAPRDCDQYDIGDHQGIATYTKINVNDDGTHELLIAFGVETSRGPRSWFYSVNIDKVPGIFWATVDAMLGDTGDRDVTAAMFKGKKATCAVRAGTGEYSENYRIRYVMPPKGGKQQTRQAPPRQGYQQPPQQQPSQQGYQQPPQQGYQGEHVSQGYQQPAQPPAQGFYQPPGGHAHQGQPPQGQPPQGQHASQNERGVSAYATPPGYVPGHGQTYGNPPQQDVASAMGIPDEDLPF